MSKKILFMNSAKLTAISLGMLLVIFCTIGMSFTPAEEGENIGDPSDSTYVTGPRRSHWSEDDGCGGSTNYDEKDYARITATAGANGSVKIENTTTKGSLGSKTSKTASAGTSQNWDWDCNKRTDGHTNTFKLTANPITGYLLDHWEVVVGGGSPTNVSGATNPYSYIMTIPNGSRGTSQVTTYESTSNRYTVEITAFFVLDQSVDLTFIAPDGKATITVSGGTSATVTNTNVTKTGINSDVTLNISNIASGYVFAGWYQVNGSGVVTDLSTATSYTYRFTDNVNVGARLVSTSTPKFKNTSTGTEYYGLNAALVTAASGQVVVPVSDCTVDGSDLLSQENNTYTIPGGVTLLVPYESGNTSNKASVPRVEEADVTPDCYRTLTVGANVRLDVNGAIEVGGEQNDAGQTQKATGGPRTHGRLKMSSGSSMIFNGGANLYAWGYIMGTGSITMKSGSSDYECLQMMDWVGGTLGSQLLDNSNKVFPINQYYVQNVEVPITFEYGSKCLLSTAVNLSGVGDVPADNVTFISNGDGFFNLQSGTTLLREYGLSNDRQIYTINGNASMDKLYLNLQATFLFITQGVEMYSERYRMPLTNNITINVVSGTTSINYDIVMNAGAEVNIEKGATVTIASSSTAVMYDSLEWGNYAKGAKIWPLKYAPGRTYTSATASGRTGSNLGDAVVNVKGTLNVAGSLYTTTTGARIVSDDVNQGRIVLSKAAPSSNLTVYQLNSTNSTPDYGSQTATAAKLRNANGSYTETTGATTGNIDYRNGHWGWKVTWKDDDETVIKTEYCYTTPSDSWINSNKPANPTQSCKTFSSWSQTSNDATNQEYVYTATYTTNTYAITYNAGANGSGTVTGGTKNCGENFTLSSSKFTRTGYTQTGWSTTDGGAKAYNMGAAYSTDAAQTFYPFWTANTHKFAWDFAGGSTSSSSHTAANNALAYGTTITYPANNTMSKDGYTFTGWSTSVTSMPDNDLTIVAQWQLNNYTITYNKGAYGTGSIADGTKTPGVNYTLSSEKFTREGYTQTGWSTSDGGDKAYELGGTYTANAAITLYPFWTINTYAITYNAGANGTGTVTSGEKTYGVNFTLSSEKFTRTGYTQTGWSTSDGGDKAYELGGTYTANAAITLYPFWTINTYAITYNAGANGTGTVTSGEKTYGVNFTLSSEKFTREGYTQTGWSTSDGGDKAYELGGTYTANAAITLYPFWTVITCTITWKVDDQPDETTEVALGQAPVYPHGTPGKAQTDQYTFTFEGWSDGKTEYGKDETLPSVTGPATYTAQFTDHIRYYTITWKDWDGTELEKDEGEAGKMQYGAQPSYDGGVPTRDGDDVRSYSFKGWYPEITAGTTVSGDQEYTAQYNMDIKAKTAEPVAVTSDETARITTVAESGKLNVSEGKKLTTTTLILEASESKSGEITGNVEIGMNAYFDLAHTDGFKARTWYAIAVPWQVNVPKGGKGGVYIKNGETLKEQRLGETFDLIYYDGARRAKGEEKTWNYLENDIVDPEIGHIMSPGVAYMIYLTEDAEVLRFQKRDTASFHTEGVEVSAHESTNPTYKNWNGIANPATYHAYMNAHTTDSVGQVYVAETRQYKKFHMGKNKLLVGQPIFIQPDKSRLVFAKDTYNDDSSTPVRRRAKRQFSLTRYELYLAPSQDVATDEIIVRMSEEKEENDYVVGQDLVKMGVSDLVPQMWIDRYDCKMFINTVAGFDNTADYPLSIFAPKKGEYDLFIDDQPNNETMLYLTYDGEAIWNLSYGGYVASLDKGTNTHYGLRIVKKAPQITTGIEETTVQNGEAVRKVLVNDKVYIIRNGEIYSVTGQKAK